MTAVTTPSDPPGPSAAVDDPGVPAGMTHKEVLQALSGLLVGMFVSILASTVVSNALPRIIADLQGSQSVYTWIVTTELLAMTATVPLWGKMADLYNRKLLIQLSLGLFVAGSLIAGFAPNVEVLIASRIVQGIGAGGMTALALIVMAAIIPPRELGRYSGIFGAVFGVGTIAGPLIGGALVDTSWLGWRWCFFLGVPFTLLSIFLLQRTLHLATVRREVRIDWLGALLITPASPPCWSGRPWPAASSPGAHGGRPGWSRPACSSWPRRCTSSRARPSRSSRSKSSATARSRWPPWPACWSAWRCSGARSSWPSTSRSPRACRPPGPV